MARFITLKALLQEGSFHFELRDTTDVDGLEQTLRGFDDMQPLNRELKNLACEIILRKRTRKIELLGRLVQIL